MPLSRRELGRVGSESCGSPQPRAWALSEAEDSDAGPPGPGPRRSSRQPRPRLRVGPLGLIGGGGVVASARPLPPSAGRDGAFAWSRLQVTMDSGPGPVDPGELGGRGLSGHAVGRSPARAGSATEEWGARPFKFCTSLPPGPRQIAARGEVRNFEGPSSESPSSVAPPGNGRSVYAPWCMLLVSDYLWVTVRSLQLATAVSGYQVLRRRSGPLETPQRRIVTTLRLTLFVQGDHLPLLVRQYDPLVVHQSDTGDS
jgi:hypothetical protein